MFLHHDLVGWGDLVDCIPIVGTVKNIFECIEAGTNGDTPTAVEKGTSAIIGGIFDVFTLGTATVAIKSIGKLSAQVIIKETVKGATKKGGIIVAEKAVEKLVLISVARKLTSEGTGKLAKNVTENVEGFAQHQRQRNRSRSSSSNRGTASGAAGGNQGAGGGNQRKGSGSGKKGNEYDTEIDESCCSDEDSSENEKKKPQLKSKSGSGSGKSKIHIIKCSSRKEAKERAMENSRAYPGKKKKVIHHLAHGKERLRKGTGTEQQRLDHYNKNKKGDKHPHYHSTDENGKKLNDGKHYIY